MGNIRKFSKVGKEKSRVKLWPRKKGFGWPVGFAVVAVLVSKTQRLFRKCGVTWGIGYRYITSNQQGSQTSPTTRRMVDSCSV